jgi:hypothetical protein
VTAPSSKSTAKVWSINPLSPALSPPDEVMKQGWKDCVLLKDGGAVLLDDGQTVYTWQGSSKGVHRIKDPAGFVSLRCNDESVALLDGSGRLSVMRIGGTESPAVIRSKVVSATSSTGAMIAVVTDDASWLSTLRLSDPFRPLPFQPGMKLAVTADGLVFGLNDKGELVRYEPESQKFIRQSRHTNLRNLAVWGKGVVLITTDERVDGFDLEEAVPSLEGITEIITGDDFAIARDSKDKLTIWGKNVPDSPQRMSMPEGTAHLTASPLGLIAAW